MIGISFFRDQPPALKIGPTTRCPPRIENLQQLSEKTRPPPPTPIFGQRVSVNQLLSQPHIGLGPAWLLDNLRAPTTDTTRLSSPFTFPQRNNSLTSRDEKYFE